MAVAQFGTLTGVSNPIITNSAKAEQTKAVAVQAENPAAKAKNPVGKSEIPAVNAFINDVNPNEIRTATRKKTDGNNFDTNNLDFGGETAGNVAYNAAKNTGIGGGGGTATVACSASSSGSVGGGGGTATVG